MSADLDLAQMLVSLPKWRWEPGMRVLQAGFPNSRGTVTGYASPDRGYLDVAWDDGVHNCRTDQALLLPDLTAAATCGVLLLLLGERLLTVDALLAGASEWTTPGLQPSLAPFWRIHLRHCYPEPYVEAGSLGEAAARALFAIARCSP